MTRCHFCTQQRFFQMDAKRKAFRSCCNDVRLAIRDLENLSFKLYTAGLIPAEVRDRREAGEIVSAAENRLGYDESAWDRLIEVFRRSDGGATVARRLTDQLRVELSKENAPDAGGNIPHGQRPNRGGSPPACVLCI